jgi:hypothetical protein
MDFITLEYQLLKKEATMLEVRKGKGIQEQVRES